MVLRRAGLEVVDAHVAFLARPAGGDRQLAVGQEDHAEGSLGPREHPAVQLAGGHVPDQQFVMAADDQLVAVGRESQGRDDIGKLVRGRRQRRLPADPQLAHQAGLGIDARIQLGPLIDPAGDEVDLLLGQRLADVRRRHAILAGAGQQTR